MSDSNLRAATQRSQLIELPDGSTIELRPLVIRDWGTLEEEALKAAKREFLTTYLENLDLIPEDKRAAKEREIWERAEAFSVDSLPQKQGLPYVQWWFTQTFKGRLMAVWLSARRARPEITHDEIAAIFQRVGEAALNDAKNAVGELSKSQLGNGEAPAAGPANTAR